MSVPWEKKLQQPKYFIRRLLRDQKVPTEFIDRPKLSFGFPYEYWAPKGRLFQPLVEMAGDMFDRRMLESLQSVDPDKAMMLWGLINIYLWKQVVIDDVDPESVTQEVFGRARKLDLID
jgi:hypothetical protein